MRRALRGLAGVCVVLAATVLLLEVGVRLLGLDLHRLRPVLRYNGGDLEVHGEAADAWLHYAPIPGASQHSLGGDPTPRPYTVHIGPDGARGEALPIGPPAPGGLRVIFTGASMLYGVGVEDDQTLSARLETRLAERLPGEGPIEVYDFGTPGYTDAQSLRVARRELALHSPDLILVQRANEGPRLFDLRILEGGDPSRFYTEDPWMFCEYLPAPPGTSRILHRWLLRHSALFRMAVAWHRGPRGLDPRCADAVAAAEANALLAEARARAVPVFFVHIPDWGGTIAGPDYVWGRVLDLYEPGHRETYYLGHPPAEDLDAYATRLASLLAERGVERGDPASLRRLSEQLPAVPPAGFRGQLSPPPPASEWPTSWQTGLAALRAALLLAPAVLLLALLAAATEVTRRRRRHG
ncbi:MAG: hypothetical protein H6744_10640 [Deltaproteobacteria bacterium]|nr:hypothetical protein [Deltaproteobacteria bacterium]